MMNYPFRNLVFEGGGVKGIAYAGAMRVLESEGILAQLHRVGGTSAGAINAVLLAANFNANEMLKELKELDFNDFRDDSWGALRDMKRLKEEYGWYRGDFFKDWIGDLLKRKTGSQNITFRGLGEHTGKELYVYASNISTGYAEVFSPEHSPRTRVVDAVRRSMSIPLFFKAVRDDRGDVFVDGGMVNNFPVKLFDREKYLFETKLKRVPKYYTTENKKLASIRPTSSPYIYNKETLGFRLDSAKEIAVFRDGEEPTRTDIDNFLEYTIQLVKSLLAAQESQHLHSDDWARTIYIDTKGVGTMDFGLSDTKKNQLVASGKKAAVDYLKWWSDTKHDLPVNHPKSTA